MQNQTRLVFQELVSYVDLKAVVPLDLVLGHVVTLGEVDVSFQVRSLRGETDTDWSQRKPWVSLTK